MNSKQLNNLDRRFHLDKMFFASFFIVLLIVRMPPFFFLAGIAKPLTALMFFYICFRIFLKDNTHFIFKSRIALFILAYFTVRSISVINSIDIPAFLSAYQRFVFGFLYFFIALYLTRKRNYARFFFLVYVFTTGINIVFDHFLYFFPGVTLDVLKNVYIGTTFDILKANYDRGRIFLNFFNELSIPILFYYLFQRGKRVVIKRKIHTITFILPLLLLFAVFTAAFFANWRIRMVDYLFGLTASVFIFKKFFGKQKIIFYSFIGIFCLLVSISVILSASQNGTIIDRFFTFKEYGVEKNLPVSRMRLWAKSIEVARTFPLFGIGFGQFPYYFGGQIANVRSMFVENNLLTTVIFNSPHNIFFTNLAEGGFLGLLTFLILILYFIKNDVVILFDPAFPTTVKILIIQFWTLMVYGLFHPTDSNEFYFLFFVLRGSIEGLKNKSTYV